ncbi:MAG: hypothetical protein R2741_08265 [Methanolobus sp.]
MEWQQILTYLGVKNMKKLEKCPECDGKLNENENIQFCESCGYWTYKGTVRFDSIAIFA